MNYDEKEHNILNVSNGYNYQIRYSNIAAVEVHSDQVIGIKVVMKPLDDILK